MQFEVSGSGRLSDWLRIIRFSRTGGTFLQIGHAKYVVCDCEKVKIRSLGAKR